MTQTFHDPVAWPLTSPAFRLGRLPIANLGPGLGIGGPIQAGVSGFTLAEVLVAFGLLAILSTATVSSMIQAERARGSSRDLSDATQLAADGIELLRAGRRLQDVELRRSRFTRQARDSVWPENEALRQVEVRVDWDDPNRGSVALYSLLPR